MTPLPGRLFPIVTEPAWRSFDGAIILIGYTSDPNCGPAICPQYVIACDGGGVGAGTGVGKGGGVGGFTGGGGGGTGLGATCGGTEPPTETLNVPDCAPTRYVPEKLEAVQVPMYVMPPATPTVQVDPVFVPDTGILATSGPTIVAPPMVEPIPMAPVIFVPFTAKFITSCAVAAGPGLR